MDVLIKFRHGLGDAVQLGIVLKHLKHYHPDWQVDVAAFPGKYSALHGQCRRSFAWKEVDASQLRYDRIFDLDWSECSTCYADWPGTKVERCLLEVFRLDPIPAMCHYEMQCRDQAVELARRYLEDVCRVTAGADGRYPIVLIHYEGNTSADQKNLPTSLVRGVCQDVLESGMVPVILDWDFRSPLPDDERIQCPHADLELWNGTGTGDAEVLAALVGLASLMVGIDSGPLHVAGATDTPTIGIWTGHHPLHYFAHADNVTHLVPSNHPRLLRGDRRLGARYFSKHYRYRTYTDLEAELRAFVSDSLHQNDGGLVHTRGFWIRANNAEQDLVIVRDIAEDDSYRIDRLPMPRPVVVDVGAHIGVFSRSMHCRNPLARIFAVECCPENLPALTKNVGEFATVVPAAMTYEKEPALLNAVYPGCASTGGSTLINRQELRHKVEQGELGTSPHANTVADHQYWADSRPLETVTLEQLRERHGLKRIDVLKLDCEGSEFSILRNTELIDSIGIIIGEYHGKEAFVQLVRERFANWRLQILRDEDVGTFWLVPDDR